MVTPIPDVHTHILQTAFGTKLSNLRNGIEWLFRTLKDKGLECPHMSVITSTVFMSSLSYLFPILGEFHNTLLVLFG